MIDSPDTLARLEKALALLRQPAYTGDDRCLPCTVVNVVMALALATGIGIAAGTLLGAIAFTASLGLIYLRGYLIPGTPTITRRYFPDRALEFFGKSPQRGPTIETVTPAELASVLTAADVATDRGGSIGVTPDFQQRWDERLSSDGAAEPSANGVGETLGADEVERLDDAAFVLDGQRRVRWESTAALAADVAAAPELRTRIGGWETLDVDERRDLLTGVRLVRERCPACGDAVTTTVERLEHCCRRPRVGIRSVCEGCERPLVELVVSESSADHWLELVGVAAADDAASRSEDDAASRP